MRKTFVIALREYNAAVRTRAFLIGLLVMPVLMGGSIVVQALLRDFRDTKEKRFAVVDRTPGAVLIATLRQAVADYNESTVDAQRGAVVLPPFALDEVEPPTDTPAAVDALRLELSDRVRKGTLAGVLEIEPDAARYPPANDPERSVIRYQSSRLMEREFADLAKLALTGRIQQLRCADAGLPLDKVRNVVAPVEVASKGLSVLRSDGTGVEDASDQSRIASLAAPMVLMLLMFMMVLMTATPLMQGVVEEKMQRIAEVLLGSVPPFQLMLGKILGMTAVSLTMAALYLGGTYWTAHRYGFAEQAPVGLIGWFLLYQTLASLMYGSLFIAVGAACTDMKETQNLMWPVMLLASMPMFVMGNVLREPNSVVVTGVSFFPFATPMLMIARQAVPPGVPIWQPIVGVAGVLATTLACVWAAGRIFRVGILMQGKGASIGELAKWVFRA